MCSFVALANVSGSVCTVPIGFSNVCGSACAVCDNFSNVLGTLCDVFIFVSNVSGSVYAFFIVLSNVLGSGCAVVCTGCSNVLNSVCAAFIGMSNFRYFPLSQKLKTLQMTFKPSRMCHASNLLKDHGCYSCYAGFSNVFCFWLMVC